MNDDADDLDSWVEKYVALLQAELVDRTLLMPTEAATEFVKAMVTSVADQTGVDERQARLYITEDAVRSWATTIEHSGDADDEELTGMIAIPGGLALHVAGWARAVADMVMPMVGDPVEGAPSVANQAVWVGAALLPHPLAPPDALEAMIPPGVFEDICDAVLTAANFVEGLDADDLEVPPIYEIPPGADEKDVVRAVATFGHQLAERLATLHRHVDNADQVFTYTYLDDIFDVEGLH